MGLSNGNSSRATIVTIIGGKFTIRLQDNDTNPDAVERKLEKGPNEGKVVKELKYSTLDGLIKSGELKVGNFGTDLILNMVDGEEEFLLQIPVESRYFGQVAKRLPNLDASLPVIFGMGHDKEKDTAFLFIKQGGESVHMAFTKAEPNGMPSAKQKTKAGKKVWDFDAQEAFLWEVTEEWLGTLNGSAGDNVGAPANEEPPLDEPSFVTDEDDGELPL